MIYELWDMATLNLVGSYDGADTAVAVVRGAVDRYGPSYVEGLALVREDAAGKSSTVAEGRALLELVQRDGPSLRAAGA